MRFTLLFLLAAAACSGGGSASPDAAPNGGNGVDDVKQACAIRVGWANATTSDCALCQVKAPSAPCSCDSDPDRGMCQTQAQAVASQPDCTQALYDCIAACGKDCACVDGCYTGHDACRTVSAARDGCVVAVCDAKCR